MNAIPSWVTYDPNPITKSDVIEPGDQLLCIMKYNPDAYPSLHNSIVTVGTVGPYGGIMVEGYGFTFFKRECFHTFQDSGEMSNRFDEVFE